MAVIFKDPEKIERLRNALNSDPEFKLASKFMSEDVLFEVDNAQCIARVRDGIVVEMKLTPPPGSPWTFAIRATGDSWGKILQLSSPPFYTGLFAAMLRGNMTIEGNLEVAFAYLWAMNRLVDLARRLQNE
jgi:hypothetical protein